MRTLYSTIAFAMCFTMVSGQTWTNIATDPSGDSGGLDATGIDYWYDDVNDQVQFRITVTNLSSYSSGPAADFSFQLPNGLDSGAPTGTHWTTPGTPVHKTGYVYCDAGGSAPSNYTFATWPIVIEETSNQNVLCSNCISVMADVANNSLIYTFDRQDIITDTEMGGNSATILLVANAGHDVGWDDNITSGSSFTIALTTGIDDNVDSDGTMVYPNPVTDVLTISSDNLMRSVRLVDITGAELNTELITVGNTLQLNLSEQTSGIYFLELIHANDITTIQKIAIR
jgi:hypothetical protein